jgi:hypothetical protein
MDSVQDTDEEFLIVVNKIGNSMVKNLCITPYRQEEETPSTWQTHLR